MEVTLAYSYYDEGAAESGAAICVNKYRNKVSKEVAVKSGHLSILEHLPLTFFISGISRSCSHQLVRHRHNSYSQMSQRYVELNPENDWYVVPSSIADKALAASLYLEFMDKCADMYKELLAYGVPKEDARMVLPNATCTSLVLTTNARALVEQCKLRLCKRAQWEIREMYQKMAELASERYPTLKELLKPDCASCKEVHKCSE